MDDLDDEYVPLGFGKGRNALLVYKPLDGRLALMSEDLERNRDDKIVFSHPSVDTASVLRLGKYGRLVAVGYHTDRPHMHYFDEEIEALSQKIARVMPGKFISVIDESWDQRYYLVLVGSDQDPGAYYRLDLQESRMEEIFPRRPEFDNVMLAEMQPVSYQARDGIEVPGYLTLPVGREAGSLPVVIMPHGGPESRDVWDFDWLA
jgi:dipeptidyl aminopeptidase/acylaminoacyl peptidase